MNYCIQKPEILELMTKGKTTLIKKDFKGAYQNNYRPITCLLMMWKILEVQILENIYYSLISHKLFPKEQKGCHQRNDYI